MGKLLDLANRENENLSDKEIAMGALCKHSLNHIMYPAFFARQNDLPTLVWKKLKFEEGFRKHVPKKKGVYAFALDIGLPNLPPTSYILYVGLAGNTNSNNTLFRRSYDYIRTEKINDRPRIGEMLRQWKGHLSYYYATVEDDTSTGPIEETLLDILIPPYNRGDFSAEMKTLLKGVNLI